MKKRGQQMRPPGGRMIGAEPQVRERALPRLLLQPLYRARRRADGLMLVLWVLLAQVASAMPRGDMVALHAAKNAEASVVDAASVFLLFPAARRAKSNPSGGTYEIPHAAPPDFCSWDSSSPHTTVGTPFSYPDDSYFTGTLRTATDRAGLQSAIDAANPGDIVRYTGSFSDSAAVTLGTRPGSGWIKLESSATASLPTTRPVYPTDFTGQPKWTSTANGMLRVANGARGWIIDGVYLETGTSTTVNGYCYVGDVATQTTPSDYPSEIVIKRCLWTTPWTEGGTSANRNGIQLHGDKVIMERNCIVGVAADGSQCYVISGSNGRGHYLIKENILEGSGSAMILGGAAISLDSSYRTSGNIYNADVAFVRNYYFRRNAWFSGGLSNDHVNFIESKNALRWVIEGNVFHGFNGSTQQMSVIFKATPQGASTAIAEANEGAVVQCYDLTMRLNTFHMGAGGSTIGWLDIAWTSAGYGYRYGNHYYAHNLVQGYNNTSISPLRLGGGRVSKGLSMGDIRVIGNTYCGRHTGMSLSVSSAAESASTVGYFQMCDNVMHGNEVLYAFVFGTGSIANGSGALDHICGVGNWSFTYNSVSDTVASIIGLNGLASSNEVVGTAITIDTSTGAITSGNVAASSTGGTRGVNTSALATAIANVEITDHAAVGLAARS